MATTTPSVRALSGATPRAPTATTGSSISSIISAGGWSDTAIKAASDFTISQRQKLENEGVIGISRPIAIVARRHALEESQTNPNSIYKTIHFQRHGQGYHNLICDILREERKSAVDLDSTDPSINPMVRMEVLDPPLTNLGILQSQARRYDSILTSLPNDDTAIITTATSTTTPDAALFYKIKPQLIIVSPLLRCLQTAQYTFSDFYPLSPYVRESTGSSSTTDTTAPAVVSAPATEIPWIAHEGCREELGLLVGNKRRRLSEIMMEYPEIDFSHIDFQEDELWDQFHSNPEQSNKRESLLQQSERIYSFLTEFVAQRPETDIAVVCHSAYLFTMCNAVLTMEDEDLRSWFLTSEVRTLHLEFKKE